MISVSYTHLDVYKRQVHNREAEEGVLRIEFYEEAAIGRAARLLNGRGYTTHL